MIEPMIQHAPETAWCRVRLRDPLPDDAMQVLRWRTEDSVRAHQPLIYVGLDQIRQDLLKTASNDLPDYTRDRFQWIIERINDRAAIGWMTLSIRSWEHEIAEIGYSLSEDYQRQGYGTESLKLLLKKLFYDGHLYRIEAKCSTENSASQRLLEKLGFQKEGILRDYFDIRGRRVDHYLYSLLRPDYFSRS